jgi:hypothetical protein
MPESSHDLTRTRGRRAENNHNQLPTKTDEFTPNRHQPFTTHKPKIEHATMDTHEQPTPQATSGNRGDEQTPNLHPSPDNR